MPSLTIPTRLASSPRMIGRLDAPGAKLEPVTPGLLNSTSPNVADGLRFSSSRGTTVTVANWSATTGSVPWRGVSGAGAAGAAGAVGLAAGRGRTIGLGARTVMAGKATSWANPSGHGEAAIEMNANIKARRTRKYMADS